eukprot:CAMPEP_0178452150 /NCGR_PEP_ID=MMETSP0689_2-20121128/44080_1 /TAXON_ID=160604 /ORGANISM="Amphidinium massartii, Strain CS-259" /LENGTH=172 /DNA_ID=CAMNT_0020077815 /DNA_START=28 /DNA_END=546 /DNA_ORIENTATION=-
MIQRCSSSQASRGRRAASRVVLLVAALTAAIPSCHRGAAFFGPPEPEKPKGYRLRVCGECLNRKAGNGYNPRPVLDKLAAEASQEGWDAPEIEVGKCVGGCDFGPNVRLVNGELALPVVCAGMTEDEQQTKAYLSCENEQTTTRAFGLTLRHMKEAKESPAEAGQEDLLNQL